MEDGTIDFKESKIKIKKILSTLVKYFKRAFANGFEEKKEVKK